MPSVQKTALASLRLKREHGPFADTMHVRESRSGPLGQGSKAARNSNTRSSSQIRLRFAQHTASPKVPESKKKKMKTACTSLTSLPRFQSASKSGCFSLENSPQPILDGQQLSPRFGPKSPICLPHHPTPPCHSLPLPSPLLKLTASDF